MEHKEQVVCHYLQLLDDLKWSTQEVDIRSVMTVNKVKDKQIALRNGQARELLFKRYRERSVIKISRGCYVFTSNKNTLTLDNDNDNNFLGVWIIRLVYQHLHMKILKKFDCDGLPPQ